MRRNPIVPVALVGALAVAAVVAACGDSTGPGGARSVALIVNSVFVDYDTADYGSEASEMEHTLRSFGVQINPITAYDSTTLAGVLATSQALIFPEAFSAIPESLSTGTLALIRDWVDSTGGVLIVVPESDNRALLDSLFGYTITGGSSHNTYDLGAGAAGTAFAGAASLVWDNDGTYVINAASLPVGAHVVYANGTDVVVSVIPQGRGVVVTLGWDWYNAAPHGSQDGGWIDALRRALRES